MKHFASQQHTERATVFQATTLDTVIAQETLPDLKLAHYS
jgi:hypothetical protein